MVGKECRIPRRLAETVVDFPVKMPRNRCRKACPGIGGKARSAAPSRPTSEKMLALAVVLFHESEAAVLDVASIPLVDFDIHRLT